MLKKIILVPLGIFIAMMIATSMFPAFTGMAGTFTTTATTALLAILPKFALGALILGIALMIPHWTRKHAAKIILWSIVAAVVSGSITTVLAWGQTQTAAVAPTAMSFAGDLIGKVMQGLSAGIQ